MMLENVGILSALRSPIAKGNKGAFKSLRPDDLSAFVVKELLLRSKFSESDIEDLVFGCAMPEAEQGMNVARIIALRANLPNSVSAATVNRFCASGLNAVSDIAKSIAVNQIRAGIGGGVESMSMIPMGGHKPSANPYLMENYHKAYMSMGLTAEEVALKFAISRSSQDEHAFESHKRAINAIKNGCFRDEIVSIPVSQNAMIDEDEGPRADTNIGTLSKLKPCFKINGSVTAGNSSQISDGAAAVLLMNSKDAKDRGFKVRAYFRAFATTGVDPDIMGIGPVYAIKKLLSLTELKLKDIDVWEINEAFSAQFLYCINELKLPKEKVNPLGGAVALGHPLGCTGARQVATILHYMERHNLRYGVCSMCVGGGMGAAALIELAS